MLTVLHLQNQLFVKLNDTLGGDINGQEVLTDPLITASAKMAGLTDKARCAFFMNHAMKVYGQKALVQEVKAGLHI